jgi:hypothetical protein
MDTYWIIVRVRGLGSILDIVGLFVGLGSANEHGRIYS